MTDLLDPRTADKLAKLCGMFGSDHLCEVATAARMADRLVKESGLSWFDVIAPRAAEQSTPAQKIAFALAHINVLACWERGFLYGVNAQRKPLSDKQLAVLDEIAAKAAAYARAA